MEVIRKSQLASESIKEWQQLDGLVRAKVIQAMAEKLEDHAEKILEANRLDTELAVKNGISRALLDRLTLTDKRIVGMAQGLRDVSKLSDPIGQVISGQLLPNGLKIEKVRVPIGVIGMIYEARPNVTADAAGLCLKAGNAVILRGGSEAINSNRIIVQVLRQAIVEQKLSPEILQVVENTDRREVQQMVRLNQYIDVIIPRGGTGLIETVVQNSTVPVIETGIGNCHIYVDKIADLQLAVEIIKNAKVQRPGVCNAVETVLVNQKIAQTFLPILYQVLTAEGVTIRGCKLTKAIIKEIDLADEDDWKTEYLDLILAVKTVSTLTEALAHIDCYGSKHSEAIITESYQNAQEFLKNVDAAAVYVNASTRFTDGAQFGMGAEIGISTQKLHARGPMGLNELTTFKYMVYGNGNIRIE